jgi:uncharacterized ion transporter superfamily protein YfcC
MNKIKPRTPDTLILILVILTIFVALTWVIPAGEFDYGEFEGRKTAIPGTYHRVEQAPQGLKALLTAPIKGFMSAAQVIGFCFLVGGAFGILNATGAIEAGLYRVIRRGEEKRRLKKWILVFIMLFFSISGATFGMSESVLVFILITVPLAIAMGYDSIVGICISFLAAGVGFAGALTNPFTIGIAQGISELTLFSGWEYRLFIWVVLTGILIFYVLRYARKIEKNPEKSSVFHLDKRRTKSGYDASEQPVFTSRRKVIIALLFGAIVLLVIGSNVWKWYINEISAVFLILGVLAAVVAGIKASRASKAFVEGARGMLMAALIIALSKGLLVVATDGKIIDTMLNGIANATGNLPVFVSAQMMFLFQGVLNFFIPSGSGQAALTMPIMAPLSDILGISRQTAVLCFQMGDGIFNMIIPTSGVTMGVLSIANIPYQKWFRWVLPFTIILVILVFLLLVPPILLFTYN